MMYISDNKNYNNKTWTWDVYKRQVLEYQLQYKKHHKKEKALKKELFSCAIDVRNMDQRMLDLRQSIENV